jgi:hypothetical protein
MRVQERTFTLRFVAALTLRATLRVLVRLSFRSLVLYAILLEVGIFQVFLQRTS